MDTQTQEDTKKRSKLGLTPTQKKVYDTIVKFIEANKYSPSYEELKQILKVIGSYQINFELKSMRTLRYFLGIE